MKHICSFANTLNLSYVYRHDWRRACALVLFALALLSLTACGNSSPRQQWQPENDGLLAAAISADGQNVLIGNDKGQANLWSLDAKNAELAHRWAHQKASEDGIDHVALSDNGLFALTADEATLVWWNVQEGSIAGLWQLKNIESLALSVDGQKALIGLKNEVQFFDLARSKLLQRLEHPDRVRSVSLSDDMSLGISGSDQATAKVWDLKKGELLHAWSYKGKLSVVRLSADGEFALTNPALDHIYLYAIDSGKLIKRMSHRNTTLADADFSADDRDVMTAQLSRVVERWKVSNGKLLGEIKPNKPLLKAEYQTILSLKLTQNDGKTSVIIVYSNGVIERHGLP